MIVRKTPIQSDTELLEESPLMAVDETGLVKSTVLTTLPTALAEADITSFLATAAQLDNLKPAISLTPSYREFNAEGEKLRGVFLGLKTVQKKDDAGNKVPLDCVQWLDPSGEVYLNAGVTLVGAFEHAQILPGTAIEIEYQGKRDRAKVFAVRILN
jgi:hypothetical protein